jgi:uncharacterized protein
MTNARRRGKRLPLSSPVPDAIALEPDVGEQSPYALALAAARRGESDEVVRRGMESAARKRDPRAEYSLATWFLSGAYGYPEAPVRAVRLLRRAAAGGIPDAMFDLAVSYETGKGARRDLCAAFQWYVRAALRGDRAACVHVANCYASGTGVPTDIESALLWYEWAEARGVDGGEAAKFRAWLEPGDE